MECNETNEPVFVTGFIDRGEKRMQRIRKAVLALLLIWVFCVPQTPTASAETIYAKDQGEIVRLYSVYKQWFRLRTEFRDQGRKIKYSSDTPKVRVSPMGKVTIGKEFIGTATITVEAEETETEAAETMMVQVTVQAPMVGEQELYQSYMTENPRYKENRPLRPKGLMLHSVNCPQPSAMAFIERWNNPEYVRASIHAFIDADSGIVYQALPWTTRANHCWKGPKGCGNDSYIGVEMCESPNIYWLDRDTIECYDDEEALAAVERTYGSAVQLFAMLCVRFDLDPLEDGVVLSHHEGFLRGIASDHGDPENLWKAMGTDYTMDGFRKDVSEAMENYE